LADVKLALELRLDYLALSFVREAKDILELKAALDGAGHRPQVIAKIEDQQAVKNLNEIITAADGVMVGRSRHRMAVRRTADHSTKDRQNLFAHRPAGHCRDSHAGEHDCQSHADAG
jgi:citrate lyase beta subunit